MYPICTLWIFYTRNFIRVLPDQSIDRMYKSTSIDIFYQTKGCPSIKAYRPVELLDRGGSMLIIDLSGSLGSFYLLQIKTYCQDLDYFRRSYFWFKLDYFLYSFSNSKQNTEFTLNRLNASVGKYFLSLISYASFDGGAHDLRRGGSEGARRRLLLPAYFCYGSATTSNLWRCYY